MNTDLFAKLPIGASIQKNAEDSFVASYFRFDTKNKSDSRFVEGHGSTDVESADELAKNLAQIEFLSN